MPLDLRTGQLLMAAFHFATCVSGFCCCACWLTVIAFDVAEFTQITASECGMPDNVSTIRN